MGSRVVSPVPVGIFAAACGLTVANIYYSQPLIGLMAPALGLPPAHAGLIVALTQLGYGAGLLFLVPLSDVFENRGLIIRAMVAVTLGLLAIALSDSARNSPARVIGRRGVCGRDPDSRPICVAPRSRTYAGQSSGHRNGGPAGRNHACAAFLELCRRNPGLACSVLHLGRHDAGAADAVAAGPAGTPAQLYADLSANPAVASRSRSEHAASAAPCFLPGNAVHGLQPFLDGIATAVGQ